MKELELSPKQKVMLKAIEQRYNIIFKRVCREKDGTLLWEFDPPKEGRLPWEKEEERKI